MSQFSEEFGRPEPGGAQAQQQKNPDTLVPRQDAAGRTREIIDGYGRPIPATELPRATPISEPPVDLIPRGSPRRVILIWVSGVLTKFNASGQIVGPA